MFCSRLVSLSLNYNSQSLLIFFGGRISQRYSDWPFFILILYFLIFCTNHTSNYSSFYVTKIETGSCTIKAWKDKWNHLVWFLSIWGNTARVQGGETTHPKVLWLLARPALCPFFITLISPFFFLWQSCSAIISNIESSSCISYFFFSLTKPWVVSGWDFFYFNYFF